MTEVTQKYRKKPVDVGAVQFLGWQNALEIHRWCGAFYVPRGAELRLFRRANEYDRGNGNVYADSAPGFLILNMDGAEVRVDERSWIVKYDDGHFEVYSHEEFKQAFDEEPVV